MQDQVHEKIKSIAENTAKGMGAKAEVEIIRGYPVTYNDVPLTSWAVPTQERVAGKDHVKLIQAVTGAEDFSFFAQKVPGFFFFVGGMPLDADPAKTSAHHTPDFYIDESGMLTGLKAMLNLTVEYLNKK
jgi:metal-dependent amidase/aminoacylase/carboxypeptidase family protein